MKYRARCIIEFGKFLGTFEHSIFLYDKATNRFNISAEEQPVVTKVRLEILSPYILFYLFCPRLLILSIKKIDR